MVLPKGASVEIDSGFQTLPVNDRVMVLKVDGEGYRAVGDVLKSGAFLPNLDSHNILIGRAYRYPSAWVCLPLHNTTASKKQLIVDVEHNRCDTLEAFLISRPNAEPLYLGKLYRNLPLGKRAISVRAFAIPFELEARKRADLLLYSKRTIGIHEMNISVSTNAGFTIKNEEENITRLFALSSAFFFMFTIFSLGLIFRHRLLVRFGIYSSVLTLGQLNFNYFFDSVVFPQTISLNANTVGIFIIFTSNSLFHTFGVAYVKSLNLYRKWHFYLILFLVMANLAQMLRLLFPITPMTNQIITDASLILTTLNIVWLFYIAILGFISKRDKYLLITAALVFVPILYKSYVLEEPALNYNYFQPLYYLILFGYLTVSLFKKELTSRQITEEKIKRVQGNLEALRKSDIQHIGRNLHDQLGNTLASALGYLNLNVPNIGVSKKLILDAINETRVISHNLVKNDDRPLDEKLEDIIERFNDFSPIRFEFNDFSEKRLNQLSYIKQQNIYLIVQELLNNIVKHSKAREVTVQVLLIEGKIHVSVEDDGIGNAGGQQSDGIGIRNMYKRAGLANLTLVIDTGLMGTSVSIETILEDQ